MPSFFPEGNTVGPLDNEWRTLMKWCDSLYATVGSVPCQYPEGTQPLAKDSEDRLRVKINKMLGG